MPIHNMEIASIFQKLADLLEIEGDNPFRIRAYRNAARTIGSLSENISLLVKKNYPLDSLPGIGKDLAEKIKTIVKTGNLPLLKKVESHVPPVLSELLKIEGLGPKRVQLLYKKLKIRNLQDLKRAIEKEKLRTLPGFGAKTEEKILSGLKHVQQYSKRIKLYDAIPIVSSILTYLKKAKGVEHIECAGSYRRRRETLGDLDILIASKNTEKVIEHFVSFDEVSQIVSQGPTRSTVKIHSGIQVDLRVVAPESYGAALVYLTGSKSHNIAIRKIAVQKKLKINEYGIFKGNKKLAGKTEQDIYKKIGLHYVEPEMREDRGEIELSLKNKLPKLVTLKDIRGDLHCHTLATDGNATLEEMASQASQLGYQYLAITEHSKHLTVARGLDAKKLLAQIELIDRLNSKLKNITILKSIEVDILEDGTLDLPDHVLKELDLTVCSIHSKFNLSQNKQTERIIRAMDNCYFNILGHPTGRLINRREPYQIDIERIMKAARERNCILELNAQPERMDLDDIHCKMAKEMNVKVAISTDAHSVMQLGNMCLGVFQARRGWLEAGDIVNTYSLNALKKVLKRV